MVLIQDDYTKEDLKPAYDAREVMAMIQALPETDSLTLSDAADVQQAKSAYDALSAEEKAKVTDEAEKSLRRQFLRSQNSRVRRRPAYRISSDLPGIISPAC